MKSLKFFKPTLATTLAIVLASLLSVRPAQAGYTVTLQQVGPNVVVTGSGAIDLTGLSASSGGSPFVSAQISPGNAVIVTGATSFNVNTYFGVTGPEKVFGISYNTYASSASGDMVGIYYHAQVGTGLIIPTGYVSGTALSDTATYSGTTLATLGVTPGTYVWTWGIGANQKFTLKIPPAILPANGPPIVTTNPAAFIASFSATLKGPSIQMG